jgi:DNA polymerase-3 subunit gamma/tau
MPLNTDYRPKKFADLLGNESTIKKLEAIYDRESDWPHAVLLKGPRGCGKTTIARIIAQKLLGGTITKNDFQQVDGGDINAQWVKNLKANIAFKPFDGRARVWIIEEAHMTGQGGAS